MIERSAADVLSTPPRSERCSAIRSFARPTHADLPSIPASNLLPLVIDERCRDGARLTRVSICGRQKRRFHAPWPLGFHAPKEPFPRRRLWLPVPPSAGRRSPASKLPSGFPSKIAQA